MEVGEIIIFTETEIFSETDVCKKEEWLSMTIAGIESCSLNQSTKYNWFNRRKKPVKIDGIYVFIYITILYEGGGYFYSFQTSNVILVNEKETEFRQLIVFDSDTFYNLRKLFEDMMTVIDTYIFTGFDFISPTEKDNYKIHNYNTEDCSVCFEITHYYTLCNHPLCLKCREKCIEYDAFDCPICRQRDVSFFKDIKRLANTFNYPFVDMDMDDMDDMDIIDIE